MKVRQFVMPLAAVFTALFLVGAEKGTGCLLLDDPDEFLARESEMELKYILSIHEIVKYRRGSDFEQEVDSFFGKPICVNKNYFLHSKDIVTIEPVKRVDNPDFYNLKLTLSDRGAKLWSAFSVTSRYDKKEMAIVIDGMFYRTFRPAILLDPDARTVMLEGPFDPATASGLMKYAKRNYRKWNDR